MLGLITKATFRETSSDPKLNSNLEVNNASMDYLFGEQLVHIQSQKAHLDPMDSKQLNFHHGVEIMFDKTTLKPDALSIDSKNEVMNIKKLRLEGEGNVLFHQAEIAPGHHLSTATNMILIAPYPLSAMGTIEKLESEIIKTKLQSLELLQERNKKAKQASSGSGLFQDQPQKDEKEQTTKVFTSKQTFKLKTKHIESPLGRFKVRLKMEGVDFFVGEQSLHSNFAKFQSGQTLLTFYDHVVLKANGKETQADYATLDLSTGQLELDQTSLSFPVETL